MFKTPLCDLLNIKHPIIQGGMGPADTTDIAAAVSKAGALGVISAAMMRAVEQGSAGNSKAAADTIMERVDRVRKITQNPFGINVPVGLLHADETIQAIIDIRRSDPGLEKQLRVIIMSAGDSKPYISRLKDAGLFTIHVVPSVYHAQRMERLGIDAVVAEGYEGGGHKSPDPVNTFVLIPAVAEAVRIPVIAAGGIADAKSFLAALAFGAQGVQMGTRFICTKESSGFHDNVKMLMLGATDRSTVVTRGDVGPLRYLKNEWTVKLIGMIERGEDEKMSEVFETFKQSGLIKGMIEGDIVDGAVAAGQIVGRIHDLPTIQELVEERMMKGAVEVLRELAHSMGYDLTETSAAT